MSSLPLNPQIEIKQSYPSCNKVQFCDVTPDSCAGYPKGYGSNSTQRQYVTSTKIFVSFNNGAFQELLANFVPADYCITFDTEDIEILGLEPTNNCGCNNLTPNKKLGGFCDGCWTWRYEVYANGENAVYSLANLTYRATFTITIDGLPHTSGPVTSVTGLLNYINFLGLGIFVLVGNTIVVKGIHVYGNLVQNSGSPITVTPIVISEDVLIGSTTVNKFFHCEAGVAVKNVLLTTFADTCSCDKPEYLAEVRDIDLCYQTMLLAAQTLACDCECTQQYLYILQKKLANIKNNCQ